MPPSPSLPWPDWPTHLLGEVVRAEEILDLKSSLQSESWVESQESRCFPEKPEAQRGGRHLPGQKSWPDYSKGEFCPGGLVALSFWVIVLQMSEVPSEGKGKLLCESLWSEHLCQLLKLNTSRLNTQFVSISISLSVCLSHTQSHPCTYISWYK